jgi:hypothetical protein
MEHMIDSEQIRYIVIEARLWLKPKPSLLKFGSDVGNLCVTDNAFASFGTVGLFRTRRNSSGEPEDEVLDLSDPRIIELMNNPCSIRVPLGARKSMKFEGLGFFMVSTYGELVSLEGKRRA